MFFSSFPITWNYFKGLFDKDSVQWNTGGFRPEHPLIFVPEDLPGLCHETYCLQLWIQPQWLWWELSHLQFNHGVFEQGKWKRSSNLTQQLKQICSRSKTQQKQNRSLTNLCPFQNTGSRLQTLFLSFCFCIQPN